MKFPYNHYNSYLKEKFGERVQKITVLGGFSCPNRDGTISSGGCTYCNNSTFQAPSHLEDKSITYQIDHGIRTSKRRYKKVNKYIVYFQQYSNTYAPLDKLKELYGEALAHPEVVGLSIGTRPDCVDEEKLDYLEELAKDYDITIEFGLESVQDETLIKINRGHDFATFQNAVKMASGRNIHICAHIIFGFPWETERDVIEAANEISKLPINSLKIHQLHIVKDTKMGEEYLIKPFKMLTKAEYMQVVKIFLEHLSPEIIIQRVYGEAPKELILSEDWNIALAEFVKEFVAYMDESNSSQGIFFTKTFL